MTLAISLLRIMQLSRSPTPYNVPYEMKIYNEVCNQPYSNPVYPPKNCVTPQIYSAQGKGEHECRPFGYQPKRYNPGSLKFYMYDYPFHTTFGVPYRNVGKGWDRYEKTGEYYNW